MPHRIHGKVKQLGSRNHWLSFKVRAATSLLSITHSLKLLLLLSDESEIVHRRDRAVATFKQTAESSRVQAAGALDAVLNSNP